MNDRKYTVALCCLTAVAVALILLIVWSMIVPNRAVQDPVDETNSATEADTSLIPDTTANDTTANTEADTQVDYLSIFFEGMSNVEVHDTISSAGLSKIYDWHLSFVTNGSDRFCLIQNYDTLPDCPVSRISVYSVQSPTENDLDVLVPGKSITEITEVWGCPTRNIPQSNFSIARFEYDLQDGKTVFMEYTYDKETGTHFLSWYRIHD